jgi:transposase
MIPTGPATKVFLALGTTDLRKGFDGLGDLVRHRLREDPMSGHLFAFTNRNRTRIKLIYWDGSGMWLLAKRLAKGRFSWPGDEGTPTAAALRILAEELTLLLSGIDLEKTRSRPWWRKTA